MKDTLQRIGYSNKELIDILSVKPKVQPLVSMEKPSKQMDQCIVKLQESEILVRQFPMSNSKPFYNMLKF